MPGSWVDAPLTWDVFFVGTSRLPGLVKVKGARKYKLDRKDTAGADGQTLTGLGHLPFEATITIRLWEDQHWEDLKAVIPVLMPPPIKGRPVPVDVAHPTLDLHSVKSLYFTEISVPEETGTKGVYEVILQATEFLPVKGGNVTLTPSASARIDQVKIEEGLLPDSTPTPPDPNSVNGAQLPSTNPDDSAP
jgi:hypothetical protein